MSGYLNALGPSGENCRGCAYSLELAGSIACQYILITGKCRGCPADNCNKRKPELTREEKRQLALDIRPDVPNARRNEEALDAWADRRL